METSWRIDELNCPGLVRPLTNRATLHLSTAPAYLVVIVNCSHILFASSGGILKSEVDASTSALHLSASIELKLMDLLGDTKNR